MLYLRQVYLMMTKKRADSAVRVHVNNISVRRAVVVQHQKLGKNRIPVLLVKLSLVDGTKRYLPFGWPVEDGVRTATEAVNEA